MYNKLKHSSKKLQVLGLLIVIFAVYYLYYLATYMYKSRKDPVAITGLDVLITFTKAESNPGLQGRFRTTVSSMFKFSSRPLNLHILGDETSKEIARSILLEAADASRYQLHHLDIDSITSQVQETVSDMQKFFSYGPGSYFFDGIYYHNMVLHRVLPHLHKVVILDVDLKFNADVVELFTQFDNFSRSNIMGIAKEADAAYLHMFRRYRKKNKGTLVGGPPPNGITGFNCGVLLLDFDKMRASQLYNSLISSQAVAKLTKKYMCKGNLAAQDFFSLISVDHMELFYVLPCTWNRQLCTWHKTHGYASVFDQYFTCDGHINIYHGNCKTEIPKLEWETK